MNRFVHIVSRLAFVLASAAAMVACGDGQGILVLDGGARTGTVVCQDGQLGTTSSCSGYCADGRPRALICNADRTGYDPACDCRGSVNVDAGVIQPVPVCDGQTRRCDDNCGGNGRTGLQTCSGISWGQCVCSNGPTTGCVNGNSQSCAASCAGGVLGTQACGNNVWGACVCPSAPNTCVTGATEACSTGCTSNQTGTRTCAGGSWGTCVCTSSTVRICSAGQTGVPAAPSLCGSLTCGTNQVLRQQCNAEGTAFAGTCECVNTGATGTICVAYELVANNCSPSNGIACTNGQVARQQCANDGNGYVGECRCTGGGSTNPSGDQSYRIVADSNFWRYEGGLDASGRGVGALFCSVDQLNLRCFGGMGEQLTSPRTMDRTGIAPNWWSGVIWCDVTCGTAADAPVHPLLWDGTYANQIIASGRGITLVSVTGGGSDSTLANQLGAGRFCHVPHRTNARSTQIGVAIDRGSLGVCPAI